MTNEYSNKAGRDAFRHEFPADAKVIPLDLLIRSHRMLDALNDKDAVVQRLDREIVAMLKQASERPKMFAASLDGLETLFYASLHIRGMIHGDSSLWRDAFRQIQRGPDPLHRTHSDKSMEDFAKVLWQWVEAFDGLLAYLSTPAKASP